ncbi:MAG: LCP family protein, partial [Anaerolineaceae bacterium]
MTSRVEDISFSAPDRRSPADRPRPRNLASGLQRLAFVVALLVFGLASLYTGVALLARVYPALFPGKVLFEDIRILAPLDAIPLGIKTPDESSVFNQRINLLILGVDKRPGLIYQPDEGNLTDTIMIATIDPLQKTVSLLSLPRDMEIDITLPNGFKYADRINTSYGVGAREGKTPDAGFKQIRGDIKINFGIDIDHWLVLDFAGVEKLIDSVGGVDVVIPPDLAVPDWWYSDDDIHAIYLSFPPGPVQLDGYRAVAFGRYRETDSDLKRVKRQQLVTSAALAKVFQLGLLNNPLEIWDAYNSTVKTDIPRSRMPGYALLLKATNGRIKTYSLGDPV